jgi:CDP-diacylglycerol--glycerol-3-phosphate 3-phosphatidyltransferase
MNTIWTIPNILTMFRVLVALCVPTCFLVLPPTTATITAFVLYTLAALTDFLDGWLARELNQITQFGQMLDPIADKIMVVLTLFTLASLQEWHRWYFIIPAVIILGREIFISGLREFLAGKVSLPVSWAAKLKTTVQLFALGLLLASMIDNIPTNMLSVLEIPGMFLLWLSAALSLQTAYEYTRKSMDYL